MNNRKIVYINFDAVWRYIPMTRPKKEAIKTVLFNVFPFFFKQWAIYQNWRYAAVFRTTNHNILHAIWWKKRFSNQYKIKLTPLSKSSAVSTDNNIAVIIHAFYPDILLGIVSQLSQNTQESMMLYVTTSFDKYKETEIILKQGKIEYRLFSVDNLGRDILPFLYVMPEVIKKNHDIILKLHTKKSNYLNRKHEWRDHIFESLIGKGRIQSAIQIFNNNPGIGAIAPAGNILSMRYNYGANADRVRFLAHRLGVEDAELGDLNFIAGSMFFIKTAALLPLMALNISETDFETEAGQKDGTMAHVIERLFVLIAKISGFQLADTNFDSNSPHFTVSKTHYFTH